MHDYRIQSDELAHLRDLYKEGGPLASLGSLFQVDLILDANVVIGELLWIAKRREKPDARSALLEVLEAGTLKAWAPTFLEIEVNKHIATVVAQGADKSEVVAHWQRLKCHIRLVDVGGAPESPVGLRDPKDVPYLRLQERIEAGILSNDKDVRAMGGKAIRPFRILGALRAYSRASAVQVTLQVNGLKLGSFALTMIGELTKRASRNLRKIAGAIPRDVWVLAFLLASVLLAIPEVRAWLRKQTSRAAAPLAGPWDMVCDLAQSLATEYQRVKTQSEAQYASVRAQLDELGGVDHDDARRVPKQSER
ncbi:PIN domain-containing protein [Ralstonia pseudosolanacearum]|uniref:PIN domain-containing protein n=1 Tax=Ralstonia pseudosolanacearum TaxID=1310165 RepID=UPI003398EE85